MIAPHLDDTLQSINCVLLGDMADKLDTIPGLEQAVTKLVCLRTYQEQIPQLDLVLTPTGFGVVSNQNLAPASADRVKTCCSKSPTQPKILTTDAWSCWSVPAGQIRHRPVSTSRT